jgi:hypothetical protein
MGDVDGRPEGAKFRAVCWGDAGDVRRWLDALRAQVEDLNAAGQDRCRKKEERVLSRFEAQRQGRRAKRKIGWLLDAGEAGLRPHKPVMPPPEPPSALEQDEVEAAPSSGRRPVPPPGKESA